ncbi:MAG: nucleotidyltransferase domain-containing protein [Bacteroidaceae bacterium]|nr:nucleotidyltransferase domain-containing protein [Bacteroidaceae bacterium]
MEHSQVIENIKQVARSVLPKGSTLYLYGSRARGDYHEGSDWDLLILLDKSALTYQDYDVTYPFRELGWNIGAEISPHLYTKQQWKGWTFLPYYKNVERDKIELI